MDDIDALAEQYRALLAGLATLKQMDGPEMLLPGRVELYHQTFQEA